MLDQIYEQKMDLAAYDSENSLAQLTPNQLNLVSKLIAAHSPITEVTKFISSDTSSIALVLPFVCIPSKIFAQHHDDSGVRTMKKKTKSLWREDFFARAEDNENTLDETLLDPYFMDKFISGATVNEKAKQMLKEKMTHFGKNRLNAAQVIFQLSPVIVNGSLFLSKKYYGENE